MGEFQGETGEQNKFEVQLKQTGYKEEVSPGSNCVDYKIDFLIKHKEYSINDFDLYTTLGTGTFGRVRQVKIKEDPSGQVYALKMLKKTEIVRLNQVEHIKSEKSILEKVNHPFLVQLYNASSQLLTLCVNYWGLLGSRHSKMRNTSTCFSSL